VAVKVQAAVDVVRNAVALMFSTVASAALGMMFWIVGARLYDVGDLGRASAAVSAITLLGGLSQLSLHSVFIRFLPTAGAATGRFIGLSYFASGSIAVLLAVGFFMFGFGADFLPPGSVSLGIFCVAVVCSSFSGLQDSVLTALRRTTWVPIENIAIAVGKLGLLPVLTGGMVMVPLLIAWGAPIVVAVLVLTVAIFLRLAPLQARRTRGRQALPTQRELFAFMTAENLNGILGNLTLYLPPLLVTAVLGPEQAGVFYVPWLIGTALIALTWNVLVSLVVEAATDPAHIRAQVRHAMRLLLLVCVGGGTALAAGAPIILAALGSRYAAGADSLRLIGLALPFGVVGTLFSVTGFMAKRAWPMFFVQLASTTMFLGGAYVAMSRLGYGAAGAAGAFAVAEALMALVLLPVTVIRLRALIHTGDTVDEKVPARGVAPVSARGIATVPRLRPGYDTGPMQVFFLPAAVVDWERLGQIDTVLLDRIGDGEPDPDSGLRSRWPADMTLPLQRVTSSETTVIILNRQKPNRQEPNRQEPNRQEPNRQEPSRQELGQSQLAESDEVTMVLPTPNGAESVEATVVFPRSKPSPGPTSSGGEPGQPSP
jgi:O-antigen/teichoic acid export membrane protein